MAVTVSISDSFDGGNIEVISVSEPVVSAGGRTAKCTVTVHVKPGEFVHCITCVHRIFLSRPNPNKHIRLQSEILHVMVHVTPGEFAKCSQLQL